MRQMIYAFPAKSNWWGYVGKKMVTAILVFFVLTVLFFTLSNLEWRGGEIIGVVPTLTREDMLARIQENHLDKPLFFRYFLWMGGMLSGDWGLSWEYTPTK